MQHRVPLAKLPEGLVFPAHLRERLEYDAGRRELVFRGFMTKYTYDELFQLSTDGDFREALERIFVHTSEEVQTPPRPKLPLIAAFALAASIVIGAAVVWMLLHQPHPAPGGNPDAMHAAGR